MKSITNIDTKYVTKIGFKIYGNIYIYKDNIKKYNQIKINSQKKRKKNKLKRKNIIFFSFQTSI